MTATKNIISGAKRKNFDKEYKQKCVMFKFSAGAYLTAVLPRISSWNGNQASVEYMGKNFEVCEIKAWYDENRKHIDSKIVLLYETNKITVHSYNSTLNMKIEGKGHVEFAEVILEPMFKSDILTNVDP